MAFIATSLRANSFQGLYAPSSAALSHGSHAFSPYSTNGANSLQPEGPRNSAASLTETPRKVVRVGMATTIRSLKISAYFHIFDTDALETYRNSVHDFL